MSFSEFYRGVKNLYCTNILSMQKIYAQGPDFDDMSSFFLCEIDDVIQYINLGYGAQAPKLVIL